VVESLTARMGLMPTTMPRALVSRLQMSCGLVCLLGTLRVVVPGVTRQ
jgi:hypothetical protein